MHNFKLISKFFTSIALLMVTGCNISGQVTLDGIGIAGVVVTLTGDVSAQTTTTANGSFTFKEVPSGNYTVTMSAPDGFQRNPALSVFKSTNNSSVSHVDFSLESNTTRELPSGEVIGGLEDNGIAVWKGLPYATPPINELRWRAPQPEKPWHDTYLAIQPSDMCPQYADMLSGLPKDLYGSVIGSEDCLYLNIWAPSDSINPNRPVMFWIHGGGNSIGEGITYNGKWLADKYGVVVVTINYRLGPLGWFRHDALRELSDNAADHSGNYGTLDIIQALNWVQNNIYAFGGDANNVTVFGESAGGTDTLTMLASPLAKGLFHRAIVQSGGLQWNTTTEAENFSDDDAPGLSSSSNEVISQLLLNAGFANSKEAAVAALKAMTPQAIRAFIFSRTPEQLISVYDGRFAGMLSFPKVFRDGYVLPDQEPLNVFQSGQYNQVPTILGTNRDEQRLFMIFNPEYTTVVADLIPLVKDKTDYEVVSKYYSDFWKIRGADEIAAAMEATQGDSVYVYRFDWDEEPNILGVDLSLLLGAGHIMEVGFAFGDPNTFVVPSYKPFTYTNTNQAGRDFLAANMSSYWASFARTGNPGFGYFSELNTPWLAWESEGSNKTLILDTEQDQGILMTDLELNRDELRESLESESRLSTLERKCNIYRDIFGETTYYNNECSL